MDHYGAFFECRVFATSASVSLVRDPQNIGFLEVKIGWISERQTKRQAALHASKQETQKNKTEKGRGLLSCVFLGKGSGGRAVYIPRCTKSQLENPARESLDYSLVYLSGLVWSGLTADGLFCRLLILNF